MTTTKKYASAGDYDDLLESIARSEFANVGTLKTRGSDALDIHEVGVSELLTAMRRAFIAGRSSVYREAREAAPPPTRCACPACGRDIEIRPLNPPTT